MVHLFKGFHTALMGYGMVHPAETYLTTTAIIYLPAVPAHADCIYMMYFSRLTTYGTFLVFQAVIQVLTYIIRPINTRL